MDNITCFKCQRVGILNCGVCTANWSQAENTNRLCESFLVHPLIYSTNTNDCSTCNGRYYFKCPNYEIYYCGCDFKRDEKQKLS